MQSNWQKNVLPMVTQKHTVISVKDTGEDYLPHHILDKVPDWLILDIRDEKESQPSKGISISPAINKAVRELCLKRGLRRVFKSSKPEAMICQRL